MEKKSPISRILLFAAALLVGIGLGLQIVPYGKNHINSPVVSEPQWDTPRTRELFFNTCKDCHSNETEWPWYSNIAPGSWLIMRDVEEGRENLNVSDFNVQTDGGGYIAHQVQIGEMPPWYYAIMHKSAQLSASEKQELIDGLNATFNK